MPRYMVDRFEGADWVVLKDEQEKTFLVPRRWLPSDVREGDFVIEAQQSPNTETVSLRLELDPDRAGRSARD